MEFDLRDEENELDVILDEDTFVHFYKGPSEVLESLFSHIVFLLDLSTSMAGQKLSMAKESLILLLEDLTEKDQFNIVLFNEKWVKESLILLLEDLTEKDQFNI